jgi:hypothetical protein
MEECACHVKQHRPRSLFRNATEPVQESRVSHRSSENRVHSRKCFPPGGPVPCRLSDSGESEGVSHRAGSGRPGNWKACFRILYLQFSGSTAVCRSPGCCRTEFNITLRGTGAMIWRPLLSGRDHRIADFRYAIQLLCSVRHRTPGSRL